MTALRGETDSVGVDKFLLIYPTSKTEESTVLFIISSVGYEYAIQRKRGAFSCEGIEIYRFPGVNNPLTYLESTGVTECLLPAHVDLVL